MKRIFALFAMVLATGICLAEDDEWETYKAKDYGFQMLMPKGTKLSEKEKSGGWGILHAKHDGVEVYAIAKLGTFAEKEEARKFAVKESGVGGDHWTKVDEGKDSNGWKWFETYRAVDGDTLVYGAIGTGPKGSYLIFIKTTKSDFDEHKADYKKWYDSVKLTGDE